MTRWTKACKSGRMRRLDDIQSSQDSAREMECWILDLEPTPKMIIPAFKRTGRWTYLVLKHLLHHEDEAGRVNLPMLYQCRACVIKLLAHFIHKLDVLGQHHSDGLVADLHVEERRSAEVVESQFPMLGSVVDFYPRILESSRIGEVTDSGELDSSRTHGCSRPVKLTAEIGQADR